MERLTPMRWAPELACPLTLAVALILIGVLGWRYRVLPRLSLVCAGVGFLLFVVAMVFFRDPERISSTPSDCIVAPADGVIVAVEKIELQRFMHGPTIRIAIFMHLGNVHVQHMPTDGKLIWTEHYPGKFRPAYDKLAPRDNEQRWYGFESKNKKFALVQIAGLIARRTIRWIEVHQTYSRGDRVGLIAFGSEVDLYLPPECSVNVRPGQKVFAGTTVVGKWKN